MSNDGQTVINAADSKRVIYTRMTCDLFIVDLWVAAGGVRPGGVGGGATPGSDSSLKSNSNLLFDSICFFLGIICQLNYFPSASFCVEM